jgi:transposase
MTTAALSGPARRRRWTSEQKYQIVLDSLTAGASVASLARDHGVHPTLIYAWRRLARMGRLPAPSEDGVDFVPVTIAPTRRAVPASMVLRGPAGTLSPISQVVLRNGRMLPVPEGVARGRSGGMRWRGWRMIPMPSSTQVGDGHTDIAVASTAWRFGAGDAQA